MEFSDFLEHDEEIVSRTAAVLQELTESYEENILNKEEYQELVDDLMDLEKIDELANTIERKAIIQKAFTSLMFIVSKIV